MSLGGGTFGSAIDEARRTGEAVLHLLGEQNDLLRDIQPKADIPATRLTKFNVISEAQLRFAQIVSGQDVLVYQGIAGVYVKINHWAAEGLVGAQARLYVGADPTSKILVDASPNKEEYQASNPNELVIPPLYNLYARAAGNGPFSISLTTYALGL